MTDASTADRLIRAKGQTVTITRRAAGAYAPATGTAAITQTTQTGKGVILPLGAGYRKEPGTNIPLGSVQCLLSALGITAPHVDDTVTDAGGKAWTVVATSPLEPAGTALLYDLTMKAAA